MLESHSACGTYQDAHPTQTSESKADQDTGSLLLPPFLILCVAYPILLGFWKSEDGRGITAADAAMIVKGMTRENVTQVLGCESGWYRGPDHKGGRVFYSVSHRRTPELWMNSANGITAIYFHGSRGTELVTRSNNSFDVVCIWNFPKTETSAWRLPTAVVAVKDCP